MALHLPPKLSALLSEVLWKRDPSLVGVVASLQDIQLTADQREELRQMVTDELMETGLRDDDEPNERGLLLEDLIDRLGHL
jgi:hypothetical protein